MYDLRIVAILVANDDGTQASTPSGSGIVSCIQTANQVYNPYGVNFIFDPATDMYHFNRDELNRDCSRRDGTLYTDVHSDPAELPAFDLKTYNDRRNEVARQFPGRIVIYYTTGSRYFWSDQEGRWIYKPRNYHYSNDSDEFVSLVGGDTGPDIIGHEVGHYLHLGHTFNQLPASVEEAAQLIKNYVGTNASLKETALHDLFDGDGLADTPPDPGPGLFKDQCKAAETSAAVPVTFADGSQRVYTFTPDRENVMNYWNKRCRDKPAHITPNQASLVLSALQTGNRNHLIAPVTLYFGTWAVGDKSQTRALSWGFADFVSRVNSEKAAHRRCVHLQAYDIGGGQIRYDGVWEADENAPVQSLVMAWALTDLANYFNDQIAAHRRCVHLQAYDIGGGQIRYDGIWEEGATQSQTRALCWAFTDFVNRFDSEIAAKRRCVHLQAYDIGGGQIRYDGVWEEGATQGQTRAIAWAADDFANRFADEIAAKRRCVHLQAYDIGGGQIRYDGVWEEGATLDQTLGLGLSFNEFIDRFDKQAPLARLIHLQAYAMDGGQIGYNGIWEPSSDDQQRAIGLPLDTFANRFDEWTTSGYHLEQMSACLRSYAALKA